MGESRTPQFFEVPIISERVKATNVKFGRYIQGVHANKSRLKIWEKMEHGHIQGLPKFFEYPPIIPGTGKATNFIFCTHILSIDRNKSQLQISGKVAGWRSEDSGNFSGHPYIGRIARSSLR